jgi:hypothetical protein
VGTVSRRRISAQRRRVLQAGPLPNPLPLSHKPRDPSCTYPLPAPRPQSFRPRLFAPPSKSSSHQPAKPIECKTPAIPAVSEDVVGRLTKMPVKPCANQQPTSGRDTHCSFSLPSRLGLYTGTPIPRPHLRVCTCRVTEPVPSRERLSHRDLRCWLPPRGPSTSVSIPTLLPMWVHSLCDRARPSCGLGTLRPRYLCALHTTAHVKDAPPLPSPLSPCLSPTEPELEYRRARGRFLRTVFHLRRHPGRARASPKSKTRKRPLMARVLVLSLWPGAPKSDYMPVEVSSHARTRDCGERKCAGGREFGLERTMQELQDSIESNWHCPGSMNTSPGKKKRRTKERE